ncbi:MAG: GNAT family N-acetyltransferase [Sphingomonadaceae bacterium]
MLTWRKGSVGDSGQVARLSALAFDPEYRESWTEAQIAGILHSAGGWLDLGFDDQNNLLAFALNRQILDEVELLLCAVHPDFRRLGLGFTLIDTVCQSARSRLARRIFLEVRRTNDAGRALYRQCGFSVYGIRSHYYRSLDGESIDAMTLELVL